jgi:hypothetical protein
MTATITDATARAESERTDPTRPGAAAAFTDVMGTALEFVTTKVSRKVDDWTDKLNGVAAGGIEDSGESLADLAEDGVDELAEEGGVKQRAAVKGAQAGLHGENPVWAAIKGAWSGAGANVKAAIVTAIVALVLLLVLSPVLLLVFLLTLLIVAIVMKARSAQP